MRTEWYFIWSLRILRAMMTVTAAAAYCRRILQEASAPAQHISTRAIDSRVLGSWFWRPYFEDSSTIVLVLLLTSRFLRYSRWWEYTAVAAVLVLLQYRGGEGTTPVTTACPQDRWGWNLLRVELESESGDYKEVEKEKILVQGCKTSYIEVRSGIIRAVFLQQC